MASTSCDTYSYRPLSEEEKKWVLAACRNEQHLMLNMLKTTNHVSNLVATREPGSGKYTCVKYRVFIGIT